MKHWQFFALASIAYCSPRMSDGVAVVCSGVTLLIAAIAYWNHE